jgi:hypothetical protein
MSYVYPLYELNKILWSCSETRRSAWSLYAQMMVTWQLFWNPSATTRIRCKGRSIYVIVSKVHNVEMSTYKIRHCHTRPKQYNQPDYYLGNINALPREGKIFLNPKLLTRNLKRNANETLTKTLIKAKNKKAGVLGECGWKMWVWRLCAWVWLNWVCSVECDSGECPVETYT